MDKSIRSPSVTNIASIFLEPRSVEYAESATEISHTGLADASSGF